MNTQLKKVARLLFFAIAAVFVCAVTYASEVMVEDVKMKNVPGACRVFGKIRNLENHAIKGYVKIKFLDANNDIIKTTKTYVNDLDPVEPGQAGPFDYYTEPENCDDVVGFNVLFKDM